jgi:hypothetical protein
MDHGIRLRARRARRRASLRAQGENDQWGPGCDNRNGVWGKDLGAQPNFVAIVGALLEHIFLSLTPIFNYGGSSRGVLLELL